MWKPVTGFETNYKVNAEGEIFSLFSNKLLKPFADTRGYLRVTLEVTSARE